MRAIVVCLVSLTIAAGAAPAGAGRAGQDLGLVDAVAAQDAGAVEALLDGGADVNARRSDGATPLIWAAHWTTTSPSPSAAGGGGGPQPRPTTTG